MADQVDPCGSFQGWKSGEVLVLGSIQIPDCQLADKK